MGINRPAGSNVSDIDGFWPVQDIEDAPGCPYCDSTGRELAFRDVQDWTFRCAPGKWNYWRCLDCNAIYLDPRPTRDSIGQAYAVYYTHVVPAAVDWPAAAKTLIRNLCYFAWNGIALRPRLPFPRFLYPMLEVFRPMVASPSFMLRALNRLPKGVVMDVGCGDGKFLDAARQLGWKTRGIEMDPAAAAVARASGHEIALGGYEVLKNSLGEFDCVICSHVIEHVHEPRALLKAIHDALRVGGTLLLTTPNARSVVLQVFEESWRGLEAPRHLAIPTQEALALAANGNGFEIVSSFVSRLETLDESLAIANFRGVNTQGLKERVARLHEEFDRVSERDSDFINIILKKTAPVQERIAVWN